MSTYLELFQQVVAAAKYRYVPSPAELIRDWREFVSGCADCYWYGYDEYSNDLSIRDLAERVATSEQLREFPELSELENAVEQIDKEFKRLLKEGVEVGKPSDPWWRRGILARAGDEYASDVQETFGVSIEQC